VESLNDCDSFVLDAGLKVFQFNGAKASHWEKRKANAILDELQASRHGKVQKTYIIDGLADKGNALIDEFWGHFGGRPKQIAQEEEMKEQPAVEPSMHHISDASGVMEVKEICRGKLDKSKLDSNDAYIVDVGASLYVWLGKGSNKTEKREAMKYASEYLKDAGREANIPIARIMEGKEPAAFWEAMAGKVQGGRAVAAKEWK